MFTSLYRSQVVEKRAIQPEVTSDAKNAESAAWQEYKASQSRLKEQTERFLDTNYAKGQTTRYRSR